MLKTSTHNTIQTVDIEIIAFIVKKINYAYLVTICLKHCAFCLWYFAIARSSAQTSARNASFWFCGISLSLIPMQKTRHKHCAFSLWYFAIARSTAQTSARKACSFFYIRFNICASAS